jgi:hypothetical protein
MTKLIFDWLNENHGNSDKVEFPSSNILSDSLSKMNLYILDKIEADQDGCFWGYLGDRRCQTFEIFPNVTEIQMKTDGWAKCCTPDWNRMMLVEESAYACLKASANY